MERLRELSSWPLVVAPMAGHLDGRPRLFAAVTAAGALGFLAGGYKKAEDMAAEMEAVRAAGVAAFGVNVFVPGRPTADPGRVSTYVATLAPRRPLWVWTLDHPHGTATTTSASSRRCWPGPQAVTSFTFGLPDIGVVRSLQSVGSMVVLTVTTPEEAARRSERAPMPSACRRARRRGLAGRLLANDDHADRTGRPHTLLGPRSTVGPRCRSSRRAGSVARGTWPDCWPGARRSCRLVPPSCAAPRVAPPSPTRTRWPIHVRQ